MYAIIADSGQQYKVEEGQELEVVLQQVEDLPEDRFVTAFFGMLDAENHTVQFHSAGQGPIMHYHAADRSYDWHEPSTFPLGYMAQKNLQAAVSIKLEPGDILGLISDGIYEYENEVGLQFGQKGIAIFIMTGSCLGI